MFLADLVLLCVTIAFAYRGKGGGFVTWGIPFASKDTIAHALGAFMVGMALGIVTQKVLFIPAFCLLWFLFTKPDIGTGFSSADGNEENLVAGINQKRPWTEFYLTLVDILTRFVLKKTNNVKLSATIWMTFRQLLILPCLLLALYFGEGTPWALLGSLLLGLRYYLGGLANKKWGYDPIEFAEWMTGLVGFIFMGVIA